MDKEESHLDKALEMFMFFVIAAAFSVMALTVVDDYSIYFGNHESKTGAGIPVLDISALEDK